MERRFHGAINFLEVILLNILSVRIEGRFRDNCLNYGGRLNIRNSFDVNDTLMILERLLRAVGKLLKIE